jgi:hypothetical protein
MRRVLLAAWVIALPAAAAEPALNPLPEADPSPAGEPGPPIPLEPSEAMTWTLSAGAGYSLRASDDDRNHGGAAFLAADVPLLGGFGLRVEGLTLAYGPSSTRDYPLSFSGLAPSLVYALDETEAVALIGVGPLAGVGYEGREVGWLGGYYFGVLVTLAVRFPIVHGLRLEAGIRAPMMLLTPEGPHSGIPMVAVADGAGFPAQAGLFRGQFALTGGLVFVPAELIELLGDDG